MDKRSVFAGPLLCFTDPDGRVDVWPAVVKSGTDGSHATEDHDGAAPCFHRVFSMVSGRIGSLLAG